MDLDQTALDIAAAVSSDSGLIVTPRPEIVAFIKQRLLDAFAEGRGPDRTPGKIITSIENGVRVTVCR